MPGPPSRPSISTVDRLFGSNAGRGTVAGLTEEQLLDRVVAANDDAAFEALVRLHSKAVMSVCRRLLPDPAAADDAFQATFIVLSRKAGSLRRSRPLSPWLVGVAYRIASKARVAAARRKAHETAAASHRPEALAPLDPVTFDLAPILWEELHRLPGKYRDPIVLCWVQGLSLADAAERLRWPVGTVKGRLHRARETLRSRLSRRGITAPAAGLASWFSAETAHAITAPPLITATVKLAVATASGVSLIAGTVPAGSLLLAHGALRAMSLKTLTTSVVAFALTGFTVAGGYGAATALGIAGIGPGPVTSTDSGIVSTSIEMPADPTSGTVGPPFDQPQDDRPLAEPSTPPQPADGAEELATTGDQSPNALDEEKAPSFAQLLQAQMEAAQKSVTLQRSFFDAGTITLDRYLQAIRSLRDAQMAAASDLADRVRIAEEIQNLYSSLVEEEERKVEAGTGSPADLALTQLALAEADIFLTLTRIGAEGSPPNRSRPGSGSQDATADEGGYQTRADPISNGSGMPGMSGGGGMPGMIAGETGLGFGDSAMDSGGRGMGGGGMMAGGVGGASVTTPNPPDQAAAQTMDFGGIGGMSADEGPGDDPASLSVKKSIDQPISMEFRHGSTLGELVQFLRNSTENEEFPQGIPIYIDDLGLQEAEVTLESPIQLDLQGVPARTSLWLALSQLDLVYSIKEGVLIISTPARMEIFLNQEPVYRSQGGMGGMPGMMGGGMMGGGMM